jgi:hypothetical protein
MEQDVKRTRAHRAGTEADTGWELPVRETAGVETTDACLSSMAARHALRRIRRSSLSARSRHRGTAAATQVSTGCGTAMLANHSSVLEGCHTKTILSPPLPHATPPRRFAIWWSSPKYSRRSVHKRSPSPPVSIRSVRRVYPATSVARHIPKALRGWSSMNPSLSLIRSRGRFSYAT